MTKRIQHSKQTKFQAALALISGQSTMTELCQKYHVNASVLQRWKRELMAQGPDVFARGAKPKTEHQAVDALQRKVGQLTMEVDFLKKVLGE